MVIFELSEASSSITKFVINSEKTVISFTDSFMDV